MDWPNEVEVAIDSLGQGGAGVGRWDGRPVFVAGALPGERVRVRLTERRQGWAKGKLEARIGPAAPDRMTPPCPVYGRCGGCDWQHLAVPTQRQAKATILTEQLQFMGRLSDPPVLPTIGGEAWHYRSSARFHVDGQRIGFYGAGGRTIVGLDECPLLDQRLNSTLTVVQDELPLPGLQEITLRLSTSQGTIHAHLDGRGHRTWRPWAKHLQSVHPLINGVSSSDHLGWRNLVGDDYLFEELGGIQLRISPTSFFQANVLQARTVLDILQQQLDLRPTTTLLDGFCGVGTFLLPLARHVQHAWGIEEHPAAINDAQFSAAGAGITNVEFHTGKIETLLPTLSITPDCVVLDPPRRGCEPATLNALLERKPHQIAYVSCHPGTVARDLAVLCSGGYRVETSQPFDFFPQTSHIESLTFLRWQA